jgi:DNA polymerase III sliding clamp (beta) subunit (PCNA family)
MNTETKTEETATPVKDPALGVMLRKYHDITSFASTDESRWILNSVHYHAKKGVLEATDGRMLIRVPVETEMDAGDLPVKPAFATAPVDCVIPGKPFAKALGNIPNGTSLDKIKRARLDAAPAKVKGADGVECVLTTTDLDTEQAMRVAGIEGDYPNVDSVIPTEKPKLSISIAPEILLRLATYANKHGKANHGIRFDFVDAIGGIRFSFPLEAGTTASGVLMPMRMS